MFMTRNIKSAIKNTGFFQKHKMETYIKERANCFDKLNEQEKPERFLLCRNAGTDVKTKVDQLLYMLRNIDISIESDQRFQTWIDTGIYVYRHFSLTDNVPPDYSRVIDCSIEELMNECSRDNPYDREIYRLLGGYVNTLTVL